jgi:hypothetical protein
LKGFGCPRSQERDLGRPLFMIRARFQKLGAVHPARGLFCWMKVEMSRNGSNTLVWLVVVLYWVELGAKLCCYALSLAAVVSLCVVFADLGPNSWGIKFCALLLIAFFIGAVTVAGLHAAAGVCSLPDEGSLNSTRLWAVGERRSPCGLLSLRPCWCSFTLF